MFDFSNDLITPYLPAGALIDMGKSSGISYQKIQQESVHEIDKEYNVFLHFLIHFISMLSFQRRKGRQVSPSPDRGEGL